MYPLAAQRAGLVDEAPELSRTRSRGGSFLVSQAGAIELLDVLVDEIDLVPSTRQLQRDAGAMVPPAPGLKLAARPAPSASILPAMTPGARGQHAIGPAGDMRGHQDIAQLVEAHGGREGVGPGAEG